MKSFRVIAFFFVLMGVAKGQPQANIRVHDIIVQSDCIVVYLTHYVTFDIMRVTITREFDGKEFEWVSYTRPSTTSRVVIPLRWADMYPGGYRIDLSLGFPAVRVTGQFEKEI
jgi:hypothetical protein